LDCSWKTPEMLRPTPVSADISVGLAVFQALISSNLADGPPFFRCLGSGPDLFFKCSNPTRTFTGSSTSGVIDS